MKILFLHGLESLPGGSKVEYLRSLGHTVLNPLLPKADFDESVRIAQEEVDLEGPDLIIGSSRGGAVAMAIDPGRARLILIAPAWKHFEVPPSAPAGTDVLHCTNDTTVLYQDSQKLQGANLVPCGDDHRMADEDALAALGRAVGGNLQVESLIQKYIRELIHEEKVLAMGMCFPFAYQKAEEWFETHFMKGGKGRRPKRHPDLNDKSKFKVVHGTITDKWKKPPKPVVHGWVEMGDLVFDDQSKITKPDGVPKDVYYDMYQPEVYKEFTAEEAIINCAKYGGEGPWDEDLYAMMQDRDAWLQEKTQRGKGKKKRTLYHINRYRPARPQPKMSYMQDWNPDKIDPKDGERGTFVSVPGTNSWDRWWIESPVKSGVFLTPNPLDIAMNHGRTGHVYAYKVPEWVIDKSGGMHRYDRGSELLIPEDVWNEAGNEIEFLGKSMSKEELWKKMDSPMYGRGHHRKSNKPSWMSDEELKQWEKGQSKFNLSGLRATKHPEDVIKLLTPEEREKAVKAIMAKKEDVPSFVEKGPRDKKGIVVPPFGRQLDKKDQALLALLKKHMNESAIRKCVKEMLTEESDQFKVIDPIVICGEI